MRAFTVSNPARASLPRAAFRRIKEAALGKDYSLSLAFVGPNRMRELNRAYRGKDSPTDILSFPLSGAGGEILICISESRRAARKFGRPYGNFVTFLFIHGCVHLKGYGHGARMERIEASLRRKFDI